MTPPPLRLIHDLQLTELTPARDRNRRVWRAKQVGRPVWLKLYEPDKSWCRIGEVQSLHAWEEVGIACPQVIATGATPAPYLLTAHVEGRRLKPKEAAALTTPALTLARRIHTAGPAPAGSTSLGDYLAERLSAHSWRRVEQSAQGDTALHGDWTYWNALGAPEQLWDRQPIIPLDPYCLVGAAEFDAARWIVAAAAEHRHDGDLTWRIESFAEQASQLGFDPDRTLDLCGAELLIRADTGDHAAQYGPGYAAEFRRAAKKLLVGS